MRKSLANGHRRANGTGRGAARGDSAASRPRANGEAVAANRGIDMKPLQGYLGYALRRAQMLAYADFIAALGELSLSPGQFGVLTVIETNPGLKQTEVSGALGIQKTNFVSVLNEFERRGLAKRRPAADDRRSYALYLTPAGQSLLRRARAAQARHEAHLVRRIGPQGRQQLLVLLNRLTAGE